MKKKVFLVISAMLVFGLAIVVYSTATSTDLTNAAAASCCCCSGDSCPMKSKGVDAKATVSETTTSCCDNCACCNHGDGESCPMMKKDAAGNPIKMDHAMKMEHGKSCPMMKKDADGNPIKMDAAMKMEDGKSCPMKKKGDVSTTSVAAAGMEIKHDAKTGDHHSGCCCPCCNGANKTEQTAAVPAM